MAAGLSHHPGQHVRDPARGGRHLHGRPARGGRNRRRRSRIHARMAILPACAGPGDGIEHLRGPELRRRQKKRLRIHDLAGALHGPGQRWVDPARHTFRSDPLRPGGTLGRSAPPGDHLPAVAPDRRSGLHDRHDRRQFLPRDRGHEDADEDRHHHQHHQRHPELRVDLRKFRPSPAGSAGIGHRFRAGRHPGRRHLPGTVSVETVAPLRQPHGREAQVARFRAPLQSRRADRPAAIPRHRQLRHLRGHYRSARQRPACRQPDRHPVDVHLLHDRSGHRYGRFDPGGPVHRCETYRSGGTQRLQRAQAGDGHHGFCRTGIPVVSRAARGPVQR